MPPSEKPKNELTQIRELASANWPEDKWSFLYAYSRKCLDEEIARFQIIDDKSVKLLSSISIIITIFLALMKWVLDSKTDFTIYIYIISTITFISFSVSWFYFFSALKLKSSPRMPLDTSVFDLVNTNGMEAIHKTLYKTAKEILHETSRITEEKAKKLRHGFTSTSLAAATLFLLVFMVSYETINSTQHAKKQDSVMSESENNDKQSTTEQQQQSSQSQESEIVALKPRFVTNGAKKPEKEKQQKTEE